MPYGDCPEALCHGPADGAGRCPWCHRKYTHANARPVHNHRHPSALTLAYRRFYDPDWGSAHSDDDPYYRAAHDYLEV